MSVKIVNLSKYRLQQLLTKGYTYTLRDKTNSTNTIVYIRCEGKKVGEGYLEPVGNVSYNRKGVFVKVGKYEKVPIDIFDESLEKEVEHRERTARKSRLLLVKVSLLKVRKRVVNGLFATN